MSIEVATQAFLFFRLDQGADSTEVDAFVSAPEQHVKTQTSVPFYHNHLHDLESLWWVATWVLFFNYFSKGTPPPVTRQDTEEQLKLARSLFPPFPETTNARRLGFQDPQKFQNICNNFPLNKRAISGGLDVLRRRLIVHYSAVESRYPLSVNPDSSKDDIYDDFARVFSTLETITHELKLDFIPDIHRELSKAENQKRPRSESTNATGVVQKVPKM
jgi:hypothetical protein